MKPKFLPFFPTLSHRSLYILNYLFKIFYLLSYSNKWNLGRVLGNTVTFPFWEPWVWWPGRWHLPNFRTKEVSSAETSSCACHGREQKAAGGSTPGCWCPSPWSTPGSLGRAAYWLCIFGTSSEHSKVKLKVNIAFPPNNLKETKLKWSGVELKL